jgi:hypothetical protein
MRRASSLVVVAWSIGGAIGVLILLALANDIYWGIATGPIRFRAIGELWQWLYFWSEHYALTWVKGHSSPAVWTGVVSPALGLPALPVFLAFGLLYLWLVRWLLVRRR